jgi:hypothetical protein
VNLKNSFEGGVDVVNLRLDGVLNLDLVLTTLDEEDRSSAG